MTVDLRIPLNDGRDVHLDVQTDHAAALGRATVQARGAIAIHSGLWPGKENWSIVEFGSSLYGANGTSPLWSYDGSSALRAAPEPPVHAPRYDVQRRDIRLRSHGAYAIATGDLGSGFPPPSVRLSNIVGWNPGTSDIGKWVLVPTSWAMQGAGADGRGLWAEISQIVDSTTVGLNFPAVTASQLGAALRFFVFATEEEDYEDLAASTPSSDRRPAPNGQDPVDLGAASVQALDFGGSHALEVALAAPLTLGAGRVLDVKCLMRPRNVKTGPDGARILLEYRQDAKIAAFELAIVEDGKFRFRFFDRAIEAYREIRSVGQVFVEGELTYLRFRYAWKRSGQDSGDERGGWTPDTKWIHRNAGSRPWINHHRDGLWVAYLERKGAADPLLLVPGTHSAFNLNPTTGTNRFAGQGWEPGNVGLIAARPWIGPQAHDVGHPSASTWPEVAFEATLSASSAASGRFVIEGTMKALGAGGPDMVLGRWMGLNRDGGTPRVMPGEVEARQIDHNAVNYYDGTVGFSAALPAGNSPVLTSRAVLVYVYGPAAGPAFGTPRILALQDIGNTEIGNVSASGSLTSTFHITDDPALGADGGGLGALALPGDYVMALALPNGSNHAPGATGNTEALPTLLVQGKNPVGVDDDPTDEPGTLRWGGTTDQEVETHGLLGYDGLIADPAVSVQALSTGLTQHTPDTMVADVEWRGPADTRLYSQISLDHGTSLANKGLSGGTVAAPSWSSKLQTQTSGPTITGAPDEATIVKKDTGVQGIGKHRVRVTFYDPDSGRRSSTSDELEVDVSADPDDTTSLIEAEHKIRLRDIPLSGERERRIWREVWKTLPGGATFHRAATIRDNATRTLSLAPTDLFLVIQATLDVDYTDPPIAAALRPSESRMYFAALRDAPLAVAWSSGFEPWIVPGANRSVLESPEGNEVNALVYLRGRLFALMRDSIFVGEELVNPADPAASVFRWLRIQSNTGCIGSTAIAEAEDFVVFPSEKGWYMLDSVGRVLYASPQIEGTYKSLNIRSLERAFACYHRDRRQVLCTAAIGSEEQDLLFSAEIPDSPFGAELEGVRRFSALPTWSMTHYLPGLHALAAIDERSSDRRIIVGGTSMGFVVRLDAGTEMHLTRSAALFGATSSSTLTVPAANRIDLGGANGDFDSQIHDGLSGVPFQVHRADTRGVISVVAEGVVFHVEPSVSGTPNRLRVLRAPFVYTPEPGDTLILGAYSRRWQSGWLGEKIVRQRLRGLDLFTVPDPGGTMRVDLWTDLDESPAGSMQVPMDKGNCHIEFPQRFHTLRWAVRRDGIEAPLELLLAAIRSAVKTQRE